MSREERARTMTVQQRIYYVLTEELGIREGVIEPDDSIDRDLGADSHDRQSLTLALEEEFAIDIPDGDGEQLDTVRELVAYVHQRAAATT